MPAPSSLSPLRRLWRDQQAVTATETAFILPVLLFAVMILFELARIAMMIGIGSLALEHAVQDFRREKSFYQKSPDLLQADIETRMLEYSYGFLTEDNLEIDVLPFDNLHLLGDYMDPEAIARMPAHASLAEALEAATIEYRQNAAYNMRRQEVEDPTGGGVFLLHDEDY